MRFIVILIIAAALPTQLLAGSKSRGARDGFVQFCVTTGGQTAEFCQCAEDFKFQAAVENEIARLEYNIGGSRKNYERGVSGVLSDPAMTVERINKVCDVADEYYAMIQQYPLTYNGGIDLGEMTAEQRQAYSGAVEVIKDKVLALHNKYGSTDRTKSMLREAGSGHCLQRTLNRRLEKEFAENIAKVNSDNAVIDYQAVIRAAISGVALCRDLVVKR